MRPFLLSHLLRDAAQDRSDGVAVVDGALELTYGELAFRAGGIAGALREAGVAPGDRVGMYVPKSAQAIAAIHGILAAGAAYVPLDPEAPAARLASIARTCGVEVIVSAASLASKWPGLLEHDAPLRTLLVPDAAAASDVDAPAGVTMLASDAVAVGARGAPDDALVESDLAYILATSGSTGTPKGVALSHRNALAFVEWGVEEFAVTGEDRLSSHAPFHFDLSVFDLFAAAAVAAPVVLVPPTASIFPAELRKFLVDARISVWYSVPTTLATLAERSGLSPGDLPDLRVVLFAGEVFPVRPLGRLVELLPGVRLANLYGPTETNVCTWYEIPRGTVPTEVLPIGHGLPGVEILVVDDEGGVVGPGGTGEVWVRGPTVMAGYWGDPARSAEVLVRHPSRPDAPGPCYRTGDIAEVLSDGGLRFRGRRDAQVKHRGYRIELGEIEAALERHAEVEESCVVAVADGQGASRLVAYVTGGPTLDLDVLRRWCTDLVPRYMIPGTFERLRALPRTSTGKIDRRALQDSATRLDAPREVMRT